MDKFHDKLGSKIDSFTHLIYKISRAFPREEQYGITSQIRRATISIALNYVEGYARNRNLVLINFLEIAYGSLKECAYLLKFCLQENYITPESYALANDLADEIGAMLWKTIHTLKANNA